MAKDSTIAQLGERLRASGAEVIHATSDTLSHTIIGLIGQRGWHRLVSVRRNRVGHPSVLSDDPPLDDEELAALDAVITESSGAVAEPGLVILNHGPGQGRPALAAIPGVHVCVVEASCVFSTLDEAKTGIDGPLTFVTGPSGPDGTAVVRRPLIVVVVDDL